MRLFRKSFKKSQIIFQSTHPLRDATKSMDAQSQTLDDFNPRTPYGMRHGSAKQVDDLSKFQSTHPLRDATCVSFEQNGINEISIHAPLTGCDAVLIQSLIIRRDFNPRTPYGMRQKVM